MKKPEFLVDDLNISDRIHLPFNVDHLVPPKYA